MSWSRHITDKQPRDHLVIIIKECIRNMRIEEIAEEQLTVLHQSVSHLGNDNLTMDEVRNVSGRLRSVGLSIIPILTLEQKQNVINELFKKN